MNKILTAIAAFAACASVVQAQTITQSDKDRAAKLVKQMTLNEKISLISGAIDGFHTAPIARLGIPAVRMCDGPQGVRNNTKSTLYPSGIAAAASWDRQAVNGMGQGIGMDARARGVGIMLGPGVNIYRLALNGRNFEYYGEDPFLGGETAVSYVTGMQSKGVISTIKHFALNNSEFDRHNLSSNADERTINEIYFPVFRAAVEKGHVGAVMTSYNMLNGTHAAENPWLIKENLRKWGFDGMVMSDWGSTYSSLGCVNSGLDLEMPRGYVMNYDMLKPLLDNGVISESQIDEKVQHILQTLSAFGLLDKDPKDASISEDNPASNDFAYNLALEAPVLLKNNGVLPLKPSKKNNIVIMGSNADVVPCGGGSGEVTPVDGRGITLIQGMTALGKTYSSKLLLNDGSKNSYNTPDNVKAIESASAVIIACGFDTSTEGEGWDRTYSLPKGQDEMIEFAASHNKNVIVLIFSGGEADMSKWSDKVAAIMMVWYPGQTGGNALAALLSGKVAPSGKLPITIWGSLENNPTYNNYHPSFPAGNEKKYAKYPFAEYKEGIFVGYRGVEHFGLKPLYPFGYGLSYTSFEYSGLSVVPSGDGYDVTFTVKNTGKVDGKEVAEVYVAPVNPKVLRPAKELKGYEKVAIAKGKSSTVTVHLPHSAFAYYSTPIHDWKVDSGEYQILVGASSGDIKLQGKVNF
jgi:beta-glucosidase